MSFALKEPRLVELAMVGGRKLRKLKPRNEIDPHRMIPNVREGSRGRWCWWTLRIGLGCNQKREKRDTRVRVEERDDSERQKWGL